MLLMALASSSGGHDLMSNKAFRLSCQIPSGGAKGQTFTAAISPELPQATFEFEDVDSQTFSLTVVSPTFLRLERDLTAFIIDRQFGSVTGGWIDEYSPTKELMSPDLMTGCTFKSL